MIDAVFHPQSTGSNVAKNFHSPLRWGKFLVDPLTRQTFEQVDLAVGSFHRIVNH
jgi:hypothetical protein